MAGSSEVPILGDVLRLLDPVKTRVEEACAQLGVSYPWWIPASSSFATALFVGIAVVQRGGVHAPWTVLLAAVLALSPLAVWASLGRLLPKTLEAALMMVAATILLAHRGAEPDIAPLVLTISAAEMAAIASFRTASAVVFVEAAIITIAGVRHQLPGWPIYLVGLDIGAWVGMALRWQMRALNAERARRETTAQQAVLAERQRIAREVHDVVGHSLSVTLLHLTGARLALVQDADIDEAVHALEEAERVGRSAMADLRRSVGVLASNSLGTEPLPTLTDLPDLVAKTRAAGIDVAFVQSGEVAELSAASGLGLYRIAQESLANIVKHAPTASASVELATNDDTMRLVVRNDLDGSAQLTDGLGLGLPGMAARAEQIGATLTVGPDGTDWVVAVDVPLSGTTVRAVSS